MSASFRSPRPLIVASVGLFVLHANGAHGEPLRASDLERIDAHLIRTIPAQKRLTLLAGDTVVIEVEKTVKRSRIREGQDAASAKVAYQGVVTGIVSRPGIVVHADVDRFSFEDAGPNELRVRLSYVVHVEPGTKKGGLVRFDVALIERKGLGNTVLRIPVIHTVRVKPNATTHADLKLDFWGYRHNAATALALEKRLRGQRVDVSIKNERPLPALGRTSADATQAAFVFVQARTRMWAAQRHFQAALRGQDSELRALASRMLKDVAKPENQLPAELSLVAEAEAASSPQGKAPEPVASSSGQGGQSRSTEAHDGTLKPLSSYEPGSESDRSERARARAQARAQARDQPRDRARERDLEQSSSASPTAGGSIARRPAPVDGPQSGGREDARESEAHETGVVGAGQTLDSPRSSRAAPPPRMPHGLMLDDTNITHSLSARMAWANVRFRESAVASAFFFQGQTALTRTLGVELTVPLEYVNLDVERARSVVALGNPLLTAKYRLTLPAIEGEPVGVTLRARWAVPLSPRHNIAPTTLGAEEFSREAHFVDTHAFFLEKSALGLGATAAWRYQMFAFGGQVYADYFFPVQSTGVSQRASFLTLHYGLSVGVLPFGDIVGAYAEARATTLVVGPRRTELFTYLGVRGRIAEIFEPALFIGVPFGSVGDVSGVQIGLELRGTYDASALFESSKKDLAKDRGLLD
ncbi:MAG: hypothetical protein H6729_02925 [Deltaproteobacteria bacterium]|nr:hypothetical protein [Deltaproteobacteria bacterium]